MSALTKASFSRWRSESLCCPPLQNYSTFLLRCYPRDTAKVTCVCVRMWFSVIFYAKCFWAEDTALSCRRQITPDLEKRLELGKRGTEPSLHPGFAQTHTSPHRDMVLSSAASQRGIITICPRPACCQHCKECYTLQLKDSVYFWLEHNQEGLHHPLTHKQAHPASHSVRLAGLAVKCIPTSGRRAQTGERFK